MNIDLVKLVQDSTCGGIAAAGFGVLFNVRYRTLPWCVVAGMFALAVRSLVLASGRGMEAASFVAALCLGIVVQILPCPEGASRDALHVVGCIPMIPGGFAAKAILGLFVVSAQPTGDQTISTVANGVRVLLTVGALGTGVAIPRLLLQTQPKGHTT